MEKMIVCVCVCVCVCTSVPAEIEAVSGCTEGEILLRFLSRAKKLSLLFFFTGNEIPPVAP